MFASSTVIYTFALCSLMTILAKQASALNCYQCSSNDNIDCAEKFDEDNTKLIPTSCTDVFEARYCIKTTGIFEGEMGTKRFCSSRNYGDYCEQIQRLGDDRDYRSCVYTCSSEACNDAQKVIKTSFTALIFLTTLSSYAALHLLHAKLN